MSSLNTPIDFMKFQLRDQIALRESAQREIKERQESVRRADKLIPELERAIQRLEQDEQ